MIAPLLLTTALRFHAPIATTLATTLAPRSRTAHPPLAIAIPEQLKLTPRTGTSLQCETEWDSCNDQVRKHMTKASDVVTIDSTTCLKDAARIMEHAKVTGCPVVEDGRVVGVLSRTDVLFKVAGRRSFFLRGELPRSLCLTENDARMRKIEAQTVACAMSRHPTTVKESCTMQDAAALMLRKKHNRLVVVDDAGQLAGLLTTTDVLRLALHTTD